MSQQYLRQFLNKHEIPYIRMDMKVVDGKKVIEKGGLPYKWENLSYKYASKNNACRKGDYMNVNWGKSKYVVVDIDKEGDWWKERFPPTAQTASTGKGLPHLIYKKQEGDLGATNKGMEGGDVCYLNTFEHWDAKISSRVAMHDGHRVVEKTPKTPATVEPKPLGAQAPVRFLGKKVKEEVEALLEIYKNKDLDYDVWWKAVMACRTIHPQLKDVAKRWSSSSNKHLDEGFEECWNTAKSYSGLGIYTLRNGAQMADKLAYVQWTSRALDLTPESYCDSFMDKFGNDNLVFTDDKRLFIFKNGNWFEDSDCRKMKKTIREVIQKDLKDSLEDYQQNDPFNTNVKFLVTNLEKVQKRGLIDDIATFVMQNLEDKSCTLESSVKFDVNKEQKYNLHFKNGVLELDNMVWRERTYQDFVTVGNSINDWNFSLDRDEAKIEEVIQDFKKVQPREEQLKLSLEWLAYCLSGDTSRCLMKFNIGLRASNGKTTEFNIHQKVFPKLTKNVDKNYFKEGNTKRHKTKIDLIQKPIRLVYIEELDEKQLDAGELKDAVDGKNQNCEIMYGTNAEGSFQCKFNFLGQKEPVIKEDEGVLRRGMLQNYTSKFTDKVEADDWDKLLFPKILNFEDKYDDEAYKNAYLHILLDHYLGNEFIVPQENFDNFTKHIKDINEDRDLVDYFEDGTEGDWISKREIMKTISKNLIATKNFMKEYFPNSKYDKDKMIEGSKGCYNKIKVKVELI